MGTAIAAKPEEKKSKAAKPAPAPAEAPQFEQVAGVPAGLPLFLQRSARNGAGSNCSCGASSGEERECEACRKDTLTLQRKAAGAASANAPGLALPRMFQSGLIQAKVAISQPGDPDEQEADRVAGQVMRMAEPAPIGSAHGTIQRKCAACEGSGSTCPKCEEEERIQRKAVGGDQHGPSAHMPLLRGAGQPLAAPVRAFFEPRFGADLGRVRVHTDDTASRAAGAIGARAFTLGSEIAFASRQFAPETPDGKRLLAHELTHVIQQSHAGAPRRIARDVTTPAPPTSVPAAPPVASTPAAPVPIGSKEPGACYVPVGETMTFEGVLLAANEGYADQVLREYITEHGQKDAYAFVWRLRRHAAEQVDSAEMEDLDVDDRVGYVAGNLKRYSNSLPSEAKIVIAVSEAFERLVDKNQKYLADFEAKANEVVLGMLQESEDRVNQERIRYGVSWEEVEHTGYRMAGPRGVVSYKYSSTQYSIKDTPASRALAEAATGLLSRKRTFDKAQKEMEDAGHAVGGAIGELARERMGAGNDAAMTHLNELRAVRNLAKRDLDVFRTQKSAEFPILAAYASEDDISEESLGALEKLADGKNPTTADTAECMQFPWLCPANPTSMIGKEIKTRLQHIADVRKDILENNGAETKIWQVPRIIAGTRGLMGAAPGTMNGRLVDDKVKDEAPGIWTSILIGLLQLVLVLLAPATGGLTLIPAAAISVGQAYAHFREYERAQMLRGTDFGAMALSQEDPSLFWLAVDIVGAGFDVGAAAGAAVKLFGALAPAARAVKAAKTAEAVEEAARNLERAAGELGGEALAKAVGRDARAGSEALHVGETADEARALESAGEKMAEQDLKAGAQEAESIAGRKVKVSESGQLWSCASPCTWLRERYSGLLRRKGTNWEARLKGLEEEAAKIPKGKAGEVARQQLAERAAALEREMRLEALPGEWSSPLKKTLNDKEFKELLEQRGSIAAQLDHHPPNWTGADEARFRYGEKIDPEPGYRWTLDENGGLRYDRLDASLPARQFNPATRVFEEAAEGGAIKFRAVKGAEETTELAKIPKKQRDAMEAAFKKRGSLIAERDRLEALQEAGTISKKDAEKLRQTYAKINEQSRQLGENAADAVMKGKGTKIYPTGKPYSTSGDFDQVWKVGDEFHAVEAKGGSSGLGSRSVGEGIRAEQGSLEYAKSIAQNMAKNGATKEIRKLGNDMLAAMAKGKFKYVLVQAPIGEELGSAVLRDVKVTDLVVK